MNRGVRFHDLLQALRAARVSQGDRAVALGIADQAGAAGAVMTNEDIAAAADVSVRTVKLALPRLLKADFVERESVEGTRSFLYRIGETYAEAKLRTARPANRSTAKRKRAVRRRNA